MTQQPRIFISYSRADRQFIEQLVPTLKKVYPNYEIWWDDDLTGGEDWWERILTEIDASDLFIYLLSNDSLTSEYCQNEFREALRLQKLCVPVIIRSKTDMNNAPDELRPQLSRRNWVDMSGGFKDANAKDALFRAINVQIGKIPAQPAAPLTPMPVSQPIVKPIQKTTTPRHDWTPLLIALIGALATIMAAVITIGPSLLNALQTTPTVAPSLSVTTVKAIVVQPSVTISATNSATLTTSPITAPPTIVLTDMPSATVDFVAAAQTFDAQATAGVKGTDLAQTKEFIVGQTATAARWTKTPTPTPTLTANITASFQGFLTQRAQTLAALDALNQTATAAYWTLTSTATVTFTATFTVTPRQLTVTPTPIPPTATPYPTASTNEAWMPISNTFNDGVEMVLVPKGCFNMGSTDFISAIPVSKLCFEQPFWMDRTDVTQAQFKRLDGTAAQPSNFSGDNRPVERITWFEARDYCAQKRSARLPTEAEWEYAARGPDGWVYPWGNSFDAANAVYAGNTSNHTADVGSKPKGASWIGALDMAGNVWQWTNTIYDQSRFPYPYKKDDGRESNENNNRVLRGGSWGSDLTGLRATYRYRVGPDFVNDGVGFRCARSS